MPARRIQLGPTAQKVLLLLAAGVALGLTRSPRQYFRILKAIKHDWVKINHYALHRTIKNLYKSHLIEAKDNPDGTTTIILTADGRKKALTYQIDEMRIPEMQKWDGKWRLVLFDIPETRKKSRDALSRALKNIGFYQYQKSVFMHPFECKNEVEFVIEFFRLRPYVRYIIAEYVDNELALKKHFNLA